MDKSFCVFMLELMTKGLQANLTPAKDGDAVGKGDGSGVGTRDPKLGRLVGVDIGSLVGTDIGIGDGLSGLTVG